jgi:DNA-binding CsgD family transcriptional regulator
MPSSQVQVQCLGFICRISTQDGETTEGGHVSLGQRPVEPLIGRDKDIEFLRSFIDKAALMGGALLLSGDAGVGKTALLDVTEVRAETAGTRVLRAAGAEFEADVSFAGLNQLLHPLLAGLQLLSPTYAQALSVSLGLIEGPRSDQLVASNAALDLLLQAAAVHPLLMIVDDLPWLDRASSVVLGFVARRLRGTRVGFLAAFRTGGEIFFERGGLPGYELQALDDDASTALLEARFPALAARVRNRLKAEAQGNPLALLELPVTLTGLQRAAVGALPTVLPLSRRLQSVFASRVTNLPAETRHLLLLAVLDGTGDPRMLQPVVSEPPVIGDLAPAERARLVHVDQWTGHLAFRHPLIRSAVIELSTIEERRQVHRVLADRRVGEPARHAWHLAEAAVGPDERVAALLQSVGHGNLRRGDSVGAITELLRAAELSPRGSDRAIRLAEAAYLGASVTGDLRNLPQLLDAARAADPERAGSLAGAVAGAYYLLNGHGDVDAAHRLLVGAIEALAPDCFDVHNQQLVEALYNLLLMCFFGGRAELWDPFKAAIGRLTPQSPERLTILGKTLSDPARLALPVLGRLDTVIRALSHETSPARIVRTGIAAVYVDRLPNCRAALWRAVEHGREGGAITSAIEALFLLGNDAFWAGQWDELQRLTAEGLNLCEAHGYRLLSWPGLFLQALLAAACGDESTTRALTDEMTGWAAPRGVRSVRNYALHARALLALGRGDHEDAYQHAAAVSPPGVLASHVPHALWLVMELTEAAVRTGRHAEAEAHAAAAGEAGIAAISTRLALTAGASAAIAASDQQSLEVFERTLAIPGIDRWPFDLARVRLAYGERLRRAKAATEAREQLTAASDTFQRLGAEPWTVRARKELRATGISIGQAATSGPASLTPQELEIAMLAAAGLTNKQIGQRLFLSHRTVGTHLYQLFPKLGITSRAALSDALRDRPSD